MADFASRDVRMGTSLLVFFVILAADLWRRRAAIRGRTSTLPVLDGMATAAVLAFAGARLATLFASPAESEYVRLGFEALGSVILFFYLWSQGGRALKGPRAAGQITGEALLFMGALVCLCEFLGASPSPRYFHFDRLQWVSLLAVIAGTVLRVESRRRFKNVKGEHRILEHVSQKGDVLQPEYHRATAECPNPQRWRMYDSMTAELEVLQFLKTLVTTVKPNLIVETGTFMGVSTIWMAEGLKENGFGKIITCEFDPTVFAKAKERIDASGLKEWIECRNESSLETVMPGTIDLLFSDSDLELREKEVRRFLSQMNPNGLILMHDASSHLQTVRDAAKKLEAEALISVVFLPTPRGLVLAQKRSGRA